MQIIEYFDAYVQAGLQVIPLYACTKIPVGHAWNRDWDHAWCRWSFQRYPESNIGLLLGEIIDVEGDNEQANALLMKLTSDMPHPMYRSSKSTHHLFLNPDPDLTATTFNNIEFRAYRHQSVLPPSRHSDGSQYHWLVGTKFPVPPMPEALLNYYKAINAKKPLIKPGHIRPWCSVCRKRKFIHQSRYKLETQVLMNLGYKWQCHNCREFDLRSLVRKLRKTKRGSVSIGMQSS